MSKKIVAILAVAGATATALAVPNSQFRIEVSTDGISWSSSETLNINPAGGRTAQVFARTSVRYIQNDGPVTNLLQSSRHQPLVSNLIAADSANDFNPTTRANFDPSDGFTAADFGRLFGATTVSAVIAHRPTVDAVHFAEAAGTDRPGLGNNAAGNRGINTAGNPTSDPIMDTSEWLNLWVFCMTLDCGADNSSRTVDFTVPVDGARRSVATGLRSLAWLSSRSPLTAQEGPLTDGINASVTINCVPAPGAAALLGLGGLIVGRRRR